MNTMLVYTAYTRSSTAVTSDCVLLEKVPSHD